VLILTRLKLTGDIPVSLLVTIVRKRIYQLTTERLAPHNVTAQQFWVLLLLQDHLVESVGDITRIIGVDKAAASRIVEKLADRGLVHNTRSTEDRRRLGLQLTDKGRRETAKLNQLADQLVYDIEQGFSPDERGQLSTLLKRLLGNVDRALA
jgi:DNA-binding MarR family transcriptional regulator